MPFVSPEQETWMRHNKPAMWRKWVAEHGHYSGGYHRALKMKLQEKLSDRSST
jgi:hypothetical protein